ncbi:hypothetical protein CSHISOI_11450 [Colletotrichum shisoi]|uniref:Uncharacterized protein n=1 Tax=Colletotrichum shisoi TaxID=2078593 RepID=A0A5Q4BB87_9PEZI|nr:hypothetical protein CSHISOI_11450 [Colletotrichum shisoi]
MLILRWFAHNNLDASHLLEAQRHSSTNNTNTNTNNVNFHVHNQPGPRPRSPSARRVYHPVSNPVSSSNRNIAPVGATNTYVHSMSGGTMVIAPSNRVGIARNAAAAAVAVAPTATRRVQVHNGARRHRNYDNNDYDEAVGGGPARGLSAAPRGGVAGEPLGAEDPGREAVERGLRLRFAMEMGFGSLTRTAASDFGGRGPKGGIDWFGLVWIGLLGLLGLLGLGDRDVS